MHSHMTNTLNTPVEVLEMSYPLRVLEYAVRDGSGGGGEQAGGSGTRRSWQALVPCTMSLLGDRRIAGAWGARGGQAGQPGRDRLAGADGERSLGSKESTQLEAGDVVIMETPGGGGWGSPAA